VRRGLEWAVRVYVSICLTDFRNSNSGGAAFALFCFSSSSMKWNLFRKFRIISALDSVSWDFWAISLRSSHSPSSSNSRILLITIAGASGRLMGFGPLWLNVFRNFFLENIRGEILMLYNNFTENNSLFIENFSEERF